MDNIFIYLGELEKLSLNSETWSVGNLALLDGYFARPTGLFDVETVLNRIILGRCPYSHGPVPSEMLAKRVVIYSDPIKLPKGVPNDLGVDHFNSKWLIPIGKDRAYAFSYSDDQSYLLCSAILLDGLFDIIENNPDLKAKLKTMRATGEDLGVELETTPYYFRQDPSSKADMWKNFKAIEHASKTVDKSVDADLEKLLSTLK